MGNKKAETKSGHMVKNPKNEGTVPYAHQFLGWSHLHGGGYDEAIRYFSQAIERGFNEGESFFHRGFIYFQKGEYRKSEADINRAKASGYRVSEKYIDHLFMTLKKENNLDSDSIVSGIFDIWSREYGRKVQGVR